MLEAPNLVANLSNLSTSNPFLANRILENPFASAFFINKSGFEKFTQSAQKLHKFEEILKDREQKITAEKNNQPLLTEEKTPPSLNTNLVPQTPNKPTVISSPLSTSPNLAEPKWQKYLDSLETKEKGHKAMPN